MSIYIIYISLSPPNLALLGRHKGDGGVSQLVGKGATEVCHGASLGGVVTLRSRRGPTSFHASVIPATKNEKSICGYVQVGGDLATGGDGTNRDGSGRLHNRASGHIQLRGGGESISAGMQHDEKIV